MWKKILEEVTGDNFHFDNILTVSIKDSGVVFDEIDKIKWEINIEKKAKLRTYRIYKKFWNRELCETVSK